MADETTYLELSEGSSHKFYEVIVSGSQVSVRFGRIGDAGQSKTTSFGSPDAATADAAKKINEKIKKGYERAVQGVRQKRAVTRRVFTMPPQPPPAAPAAPRPTAGSAPVRAQARQAPPVQARQAPILWNFETGASAFGIFVDRELCWVGNEAGKIFALNRDGEVFAKYRLPDGVKCLVGDGVWRYAGCDDGNVYDLSGKVARVAYEIAENVDIYWLDIRDSVLAVSDARGCVTTINHEDESQWTKQSPGSAGWMVRCDEIGVYHGHYKGVTMYDWEDGRLIWDRPLPGQVLFGWQEESTVYACTNHFKVHSFSKAGEPGPVYHCDAVLPSCAASPDGAYVFAADGYGAIYCFTAAGERLWKLNSGCGYALSMQYFDERLYIVTNKGNFACVDASEAAIKAAQTGDLPATRTIQAPKVEEVSATALDATSDASAGVVVECYRDGGDLRIRVVSPGYERAWHCQFPKGIRQEGARYVVDEVRESKRGGFYRALGNIRKLEGSR